MKILFDKIGHSTKPFHLEEEGVTLKGSLQKSGHHKLQLDAEMKGITQICCNRCGESFDYSFDVPLKLTISDRVVEDKDDLDIIEFIDGVVDLDFIVQSEIASVQNAYHYCETCENSDEPLEFEF